MEPLNIEQIIRNSLILIRDFKLGPPIRKTALPPEYAKYSISQLNLLFMMQNAIRESLNNMLTIKLGQPIKLRQPINPNIELVKNANVMQTNANVGEGNKNAQRIKMFYSPNLFEEDDSPADANPVSEADVDRLTTEILKSNMNDEQKLSYIALIDNTNAENNSGNELVYKDRITNLNQDEKTKLRTNIINYIVMPTSTSDLLCNIVKGKNDETEKKNAFNAILNVIESLIQMNDTNAYINAMQPEFITPELWTQLKIIKLKDSAILNDIKNEFEKCTPSVPTMDNAVASAVAASNQTPPPIPTIDNAVASAVAASNQTPPPLIPTIDNAVASAVAASNQNAVPLSVDGGPSANQVIQSSIKMVSSGDSMTYITPQGLVYIYDKLANTIYEYEGSSVGNEKMREVKLSDNDDANMEVKKGEKFIKVTSSNFKELYPIINESDGDDESEDNKSSRFFENMKASSIGVLKSIKAYLIPDE